MTSLGAHSTHIADRDLSIVRAVALCSLHEMVCWSYPICQCHCHLSQAPPDLVQAGKFSVKSVDSSFTELYTCQGFLGEFCRMSGPTVSSFPRSSMSAERRAAYSSSAVLQGLTMCHTGTLSTLPALPGESIRGLCCYNALLIDLFICRNR